MRVFPEVPPLLRRYRRSGWRIVGASNHKGIAQGRVTVEAVEEAMAETQRQCDGAFDLIRYCRHDPEPADAMLAFCWCRKPRPGMVIQAAQELSWRHPGETYPPHLGLMVGDRLEDRACAESCGLPFLLARDWRAGTHAPEAPWTDPQRTA